MPIVIPTPDEVERMDARQKDAWRKRMGLAFAEAKRSVALITEVDHVYAEARALEAQMPPDPDASHHQYELLRAIS